MTDPRLQAPGFSLWQRLLAVAIAIVSIVGAAIAGVFLLYIILSLVALAFIVGVLFTLWRRFFAPTPSRPPGYDNMEIREDENGVIIDVEPTKDQPRDGRSQ